MDLVNGLGGVLLLPLVGTMMVVPTRNPIRTVLLALLPPTASISLPGRYITVCLTVMLITRTVCQAARFC